MSAAEQKNAIYGFKVIAIVIIIFIWWIWPNSDKPVTKKTPPPVEEQKRFAGIIAQNIIKDNLKSPTSAQFPFATTETYQVGKNLWEVNGKVDAQNGFGATIRNNWYVILQARANCNDYASPNCWSVNTGPLITDK